MIKAKFNQFSEDNNLFKAVNQNKKLVNVLKNKIFKGYKKVNMNLNEKLKAVIDLNYDYNFKRNGLQSNKNQQITLNRNLVKLNEDNIHNKRNAIENDNKNNNNLLFYSTNYEDKNFGENKSSCNNYTIETLENNNNNGYNNTYYNENSNILHSNSNNQEKVFTANENNIQPEEIMNINNEINANAYVNVNNKNKYEPISGVNNYNNNIQTKKFSATMKNWIKINNKFYEENLKENKIIGKIKKNPAATASTYDTNLLLHVDHFPKKKYRKVKMQDQVTDMNEENQQHRNKLIFLTQKNVNHKEEVKAKLLKIQNSGNINLIDDISKVNFINFHAFDVKYPGYKEHFNNKIVQIEKEILKEIEDLNAQYGKLFDAENEKTQNFFDFQESKVFELTKRNKSAENPKNYGRPTSKQNFKTNPGLIRGFLRNFKNNKILVEFFKYKQEKEKREKMDFNNINEIAHDNDNNLNKNIFSTNSDYVETYFIGKASKSTINKSVFDNYNYNQNDILKNMQMQQKLKGYLKMLQEANETQENIPTILDHNFEEIGDEKDFIKKNVLNHQDIVNPSQENDINNTVNKIFTITDGFGQNQIIDQQSTQFNIQNKGKGPRKNKSNLKTKMQTNKISLYQQFHNFRLPDLHPNHDNLDDFSEETANSQEQMETIMRINNPHSKRRGSYRKEHDSYFLHQFRKNFNSITSQDENCNKESDKHDENILNRHKPNKVKRHMKTNVELFKIDMINKINGREENLLATNNKNENEKNSKFLHYTGKNPVDPNRLLHDTNKSDWENSLPKIDENSSINNSNSKFIGDSNHLKDLSDKSVSKYATNIEIKNINDNNEKVPSTKNRLNKQPHPNNFNKKINYSYYRPLADKIAKNNIINAQKLKFSRLKDMVFGFEDEEYKNSIIRDSANLKVNEVSINKIIKKSKSPEKIKPNTTESINHSRSPLKNLLNMQMEYIVKKQTQAET